MVAFWAFMNEEERLKLEKRLWTVEKMKENGFFDRLIQRPSLCSLVGRLDKDVPMVIDWEKMRKKV